VRLTPWGVITISRGCFERCCSNKKTPPYPPFLTLVSHLVRCGFAWGGVAAAAGAQVALPQNERAEVESDAQEEIGHDQRRGEEREVANGGDLDHLRKDQQVTRTRIRQQNTRQQNKPLTRTQSEKRHNDAQ